MGARVASTKALSLQQEPKRPFVVRLCIGRGARQTGSKPALPDPGAIPHHRCERRRDRRRRCGNAAMLVRTSLRSVSRLPPGRHRPLLALPGAAPRNDAPPDEGETQARHDKAVPVRIDSALTFSGVTRGLDPRVHLLRKTLFAKKKMDCRVKPGNDGGEAVAAILRPFQRGPLLVRGTR